MTSRSLGACNSVNSYMAIGATDPNENGRQLGFLYVPEKEVDKVIVKSCTCEKYGYKLPHQSGSASHGSSESWDLGSVSPSGSLTWCLNFSDIISAGS